MAVSTSFATPPRLHNSDGEPRRVGVEIEYAGPSIEGAVRLVMDCFGGRKESDNPFRHRVVGTRLGDFKVELDSSLLTEERYLDILRDIGVPVDGSWMHRLLDWLGVEVKPGSARAEVDELLEKAVGGVVPYEIVTPPIPHDALSELDGLVSGLRELGAEGTGSSLLHAFGLHLNPEIPRLDAATLLDHLRAAILLYDWFVWVGEVDFKRRLSPFIDMFPEAYQRRVLDPGYAPDLDRFCDDYLRDNPTRNRWLDLLPLLAVHDPERVKAAVKDPHLVSARPAFHYRLPNSMIDDPGWSIATEWNRWVLVERLAADPDWLRGMSEDFLGSLDEPLSRVRERWLLRSAQWLEARELAG